ncbi:unnamed protein product [Plutella xylostella]|uniref:(diamondback moth) hypothetical protein n=1 Tax=Plutella xylostella TaxID=51655 RepID=A0A8S4GDS0_PLUXY|nr:unnamed protein product [Plutella xylostella]
MAPVEDPCAGCRASIGKSEHIKCSTCKLAYDLTCANVSIQRYRIMTREHKANWKCDQCRSSQPKTDNSNTPLRPPTTVSQDVNNVTQRARPTAVAPTSGGAVSPSSSLSTKDLREVIREEIRSALKSTLGEGASLVNKVDHISEKVSHFEASLAFYNSMYEEMKSSLDEKCTQIKNLQKDNSDLQITVKDLSDRLNSMEQHMREDNVEVNGLPENNAEILPNMVLQLAKSVNVQLKDGDVVTATRVPKMNKNADRPRSVVVKLRDTGVRDALLAAVQTFNRKNPTDKLGSQHLGIGGNRVPIYVSEHLSPANKSLHAAARHKAKEMGYKFVWVRGGRILARKTESSQAIQIRSLDSLKLIV